MAEEFPPGMNSDASSPFLSPLLVSGESAEETVPAVRCLSVAAWIGAGTRAGGNTVALVCGALLVSR